MLKTSIVGQYRTIVANNIIIDCVQCAYFNATVLVCLIN